MEKRGYDAWLTKEERAECSFHYSGSWMGKQSVFAREARALGCYWLCADACTVGSERVGEMRLPLFGLHVWLDDGMVRVHIREESSSEGMGHREPAVSVQWRDSEHRAAAMLFIPEPLREVVMAEAKTILRARADEAARDIERKIG